MDADYFIGILQILAAPNKLEFDPKKFKLSVGLNEDAYWDYIDLLDKQEREREGAGGVK